MSELTRRQAIGALMAGSIGALTGCASTPSGREPLTGKSEFVGELDYADGRLWLKQTLSPGVSEAFIYDTGAGNSSIWRNENQYVQAEKRDIPVSSFGDVIIRKQVELAPIPLDTGFSIPSHSGLTSVINHLAVSDVVLGANAFSGHTLELNVKNGQYKVKRGSPNDDEYSDFSKTNIFRFGPVYLRLWDSQFRGHRVKGNIDTGSRRTVLPRAFLDRFDLMSTATELGPRTMQMTTSGKISPAQYIRIGQLEILGHLFEDYWCLALLDDSDLGSADFYIGTDIISQFHLALDLDGGKNLFARRLTSGDQPAPTITEFRDKVILPTSDALWLVDKFDPVEDNISRLEDVFERLSPQRLLNVDGIDFSAPAAAYHYAKLLDDASRPFSVEVETDQRAQQQTILRTTIG